MTTIDHKPLYTHDNSKMHRQSKILYKLFYKCKSILDKSHQQLLPINSTNINTQLHSKVLKIAAEHLILSAHLDSLFYQKNTSLTYLNSNNQLLNLLNASSRFSHKMKITKESKNSYIKELQTT